MQVPKSFKTHEDMRSDGQAQRSCRISGLFMLKGTGIITNPPAITMHLLSSLGAGDCVDFSHIGYHLHQDMPYVRAAVETHES